MTITIDSIQGHACDWCGDGIRPGEQHYTDGKSRLCLICGRKSNA
jgi:ribosomal protein L24E